MEKSLDSPPFFRSISLISCVSKFLVLSRLLFLWNLTQFSPSAMPVIALDGPLSIKICSFFSLFRMGFNKTWPGFQTNFATINVSTAFDFVWHPTLIHKLISTTSFALFVGLNLSFLTGALVWYIKITTIAPFEPVEVFRKDPFLALYFSLSSSMIFRHLCLLPSAALFTLTIWP